MENRIFFVRVLLLGLLILVIILTWVGLTPAASNGFFNFQKTVTSEFLQVTFLDVGQGDSIFIETPTGVQVLIDGGPDGAVVRQLGRHMRPWDRTIDIVVATHPDKDHVAGLVDVLGQYKVTSILTTENRGETMVATAYQTAMTNEAGVEVWYARAGQVMSLDDSTTLAVFSPAADPSMLESNTASIVLQVRYGDTEFMLTGDAPQGIEDYLVRTYGPELLESEVLKLGHHGSKTSSSELFLTAVSPRYAVVSVGKDNSYGHPHPDVVDRVQASGAGLMSTAEQGSITFISDGVTVWVKD